MRWAREVSDSSYWGLFQGLKDLLGGAGCIAEPIVVACERAEESKDGAEGQVRP